MPENGRHADALGLYLSGAASAGGSQPDPDASLGKHRSSTEAVMLGHTLAAAIANVVVERIAGSVGAGDGALAAPAAGQLQWTPPGGTAGEAVAIADGETKVLEAGGGEPEKIVRVRRTSAADLAGTATVSAVERYNNLLGMDNVSSAERAAGLDTYRALMLHAHGDHGLLDVRAWVATLGTQAVSDAAQLGAAGAGTVGTTGSFADWPAAGFARITTAAGVLREIVYYDSRTATVLTVSAAAHRGLLGTAAAAGAIDDTVDAVPGLRLAAEAPAADGSIQEIADENTPPGGVSWNSSVDMLDGLYIPGIDAGKNHGLWIHRQTPAGAKASALVRQAIRMNFSG